MVMALQGWSLKESIFDDWESSSDLYLTFHDGPNTRSYWRLWD
jgi:hypothetical protein